LSSTLENSDGIRTPEELPVQIALSGTSSSDNTFDDSERHQGAFSPIQQEPNIRFSNDVSPMKDGDGNGRSSSHFNIGLSLSTNASWGESHHNAMQPLRHPSVTFSNNGSALKDDNSGQFGIGLSLSSHALDEL